MNKNQLKPNPALWDVLISPQMGPAPNDYDTETFLSYRDNPVSLASGLWVGRFPDCEDKIMDACEPAGLDFRPTRQFHAYYTLVCENPAPYDDTVWDRDQLIQRAVLFSRLLHPTALGYEYAARLIWSGGEVREIRPYPGRNAYTVSKDPDSHRQWLTPDEWRSVAELLRVWADSAARRCPRINRTVWCFEKAAQEYYYEDRWEVLVRAIESLIGDDFNGQRRGTRGERFKRGLAGLASASEMTIDKSEASRAWANRSRVTHGQGLPARPPETPTTSAGHDPELYVTLESVIRSALRKAITQDGFAKNFSSSKSVEAWLEQQAHGSDAGC